MGGSTTPYGNSCARRPGELGQNGAKMVMSLSTSGNALQTLFDKWMVAYKSDPSSDSQRVMVSAPSRKRRSTAAMTRATSPRFIAEELVFSRKPVSKYSELYPVYSIRGRRQVVRWPGTFLGVTSIGRPEG